jgi:hypothetical protein
VKDTEHNTTQHTELKTLQYSNCQKPCSQSECFGLYGWTEGGDWDMWHKEPKMWQAPLNAGQEGHYGFHEVCNIQLYELNMFRAHSSVRRSSSSGQRITVYSENKECLGFNFRTAPQEILHIPTDANLTASKGKAVSVLFFWPSTTPWRRTEGVDV